MRLLLSSWEPLVGLPNIYYSCRSNLARLVQFASAYIDIRENSSYAPRFIFCDIYELCHFLHSDLSIPPRAVRQEKMRRLYLSSLGEKLPGKKLRYGPRFPYQKTHTLAHPLFFSYLYRHSTSPSLVS